MNNWHDRNGPVLFGRLGTSFFAGVVNFRRVKIGKEKKKKTRVGTAEAVLRNKSELIFYKQHKIVVPRATAISSVYPDKSGDRNTSMSFMTLTVARKLIGRVRGTSADVHLPYTT